MVLFMDMSQHVDAIYDSGVLKPLVPLSLPEKARVRLTIDTQPGASETEQSPGCGAAVEPRDEWERQLLKLAKDCGVSLPDSAVGSEELYE
jgi:predicted DNA-binding antitoxin AbrB/MazE fold protein